MTCCCCDDEYDGPYTRSTLEDLREERMLEKLRDTEYAYLSAVEKYRDALVATVRRFCGTDPRDFAVPSISQGRFVLHASSPFYALNGMPAESVSEFEAEIYSVIDECPGFSEFGIENLAPARFDKDGELVSETGMALLSDEFYGELFDGLYLYFVRTDF